MSNYNDGVNYGLFIPTTRVFGGEALQNSTIDQASKNVLLQMYQAINDISLALNSKISGMYVLQEFITGATLFPTIDGSSYGQQNPPPRQEFGMVVKFGALPNAGTTSVAHGIKWDNKCQLTRLTAGATNQTGVTALSIPFSSPTLNENIKITLDATNVNITTAIDYSAYTITTVFIGYVKE